MHLKSLTMKGFKSFASSTTLRFEPGITAIVGPNGSGKSNVVDAMAWVLGEQGAKTLRGGKMDDVIFAGTADRPPLGRAEVTLTIDNHDGALPIEYAEVSITRRMFRDGAGEYEINGKPCRLLDIQELLSDSGIGREMHIIVSQGHLDAVLSARPEDRRAFVEEAAGVLKHRKRKEKARRKLDAMAANLARLTDLTGELRRQLGPLGRQAEVARRAAGIQADLRDGRLRLLADDIATVQAEIDADAAAEQAAIDHRRIVADQLAEAKAAQEVAAAAVTAAAPRLKQAQQDHFALSALAERIRGTLSVIAERGRHLSTPAAVHTGRDPDELAAAAERAAGQEAEHRASVTRAAAELDAAQAKRARAEADLRVAEEQILAATRQLADVREHRARQAGEIATARSQVRANDEELDRIADAIAQTEQRAADARAEFDELRASISDLDTSETDLDEVHERASAAAREAQAEVARLTDELRAAQGRQAGLAGKVEALTLAVDRRDAVGTLLAAAGEVPGVAGRLAGQVRVRPGDEAAVTAALGAVAEAVVVDDGASAVAAIELLKRTEAGRAGFVVRRAGPETAPPEPAWMTAARTAGATWALDVVTVPERLRAAVAAALGNVVIVDDLAAARHVSALDDEIVAVTRAGDIIGAHWAQGGSASGETVLEIEAARAVAQHDLDEVQRLVDDLIGQCSAATSDAERFAAAEEEALAALYESDARISAVAEQLAELGNRSRLADAELERLRARRRAVGQAQEGLRAEVARLEEGLAALDDGDGGTEIDTAARDALATSLAALRQDEVEARLALRTAEERAASAADRADGLRRAVQQERLARERARRAAERRAAAAETARQVGALGEDIVAHLERSVVDAARRRSEAEAARAAADTAAGETRAGVIDLQAQWEALTDAVHSTEVLRAGQRQRLEQFTETARSEYAVDVADLLAEYGPDVPVAPSAAEIAEYEAAKERGEPVSRPVAMTFDRASTERRVARAARDLTTLGKVNPLALEEYAALEERHAFLSAQLDDLRSTRGDLLDVIADVDEKILELFAGAFTDVAAEFETVFATLFPGGEGRLHLTDPDDMLTTGIEVTARPPGKKVKRLSLLSGGERSLVAVALLVAIFRARPSPFYVLDEVEAALDEVNLARLVNLLRELRHSSQLLVITHQKYTMEAADVLYGVSMAGDGISQVISQRIGAVEAAPSAH